MSDVLDGKRAVELGTEEVKRRLSNGSAYLDVVVKGHWEREVDFGNVAHWYCSECRKEGKETDFCPFCGADMRKGDKEC